MVVGATMIFVTGLFRPCQLKSEGNVFLKNCSVENVSFPTFLSLPTWAVTKFNWIAQPETLEVFQIKISAFLTGWNQKESENFF